VGHGLRATHFGRIGGVFVLGIGSILLGVVLMVVYNAVAPAYFRGGTMREGSVVTGTGEVVPASEAG